jgi:7-carboxy-7-deazaguanine synthase
MLRLLEHYTAPQGEGPRVGIMSQFVRFAGCNLKCKGWPCDTPQAIKPEIFEKEQELVSASDVAPAIVKMHHDTGARNIVFTGGEPLIQNQKELAVLVDVMKGYFDFEVFTNGTRPISEELAEMCTFVMDWKLPGSGEDPNNSVRLDNLEKLDNPNNAVKFVIATVGDLAMAQHLYETHLRRSQVEVYVGAAWCLYSNEHIVEFVKAHKLPWRLNVQVHNYLFGAHRRFI